MELSQLVELGVAEPPQNPDTVKYIEIQTQKSATKPQTKPFNSQSILSGQVLDRDYVR